MTAQLALALEPDVPGLYRASGRTKGGSGFASPAAWYLSRADALEAAERRVAFSWKHYPAEIAAMKYTVELVEACASPTLTPTPVKREDVERAIKTTGIDGLRYHAQRSLCPMTREMCAHELQVRADRKATA